MSVHKPYLLQKLIHKTLPLHTTNTSWLSNAHYTKNSAALRNHHTKLHLYHPSIILKIDSEPSYNIQEDRNFFIK